MSIFFNTRVNKRLLGASIFAVALTGAAIFTIPYLNRKDRSVKEPRVLLMKVNSLLLVVKNLQDQLTSLHEKNTALVRDNADKQNHRDNTIRELRSELKTLKSKLSTINTGNSNLLQETQELLKKSQERVVELETRYKKKDSQLGENKASTSETATIKKPFFKSEVGQPGFKNSKESLLAKVRCPGITRTSGKPTPLDILNGVSKTGHVIDNPKDLSLWQPIDPVRIEACVKVWVKWMQSQHGEQVENQKFKTLSGPAWFSVNEDAKAFIKACVLPKNFLSVTLDTYLNIQWLKATGNFKERPLYVMTQEELDDPETKEVALKFIIEAAPKRGLTVVKDEALRWEIDQILEALEFFEFRGQGLKGKGKSIKPRTDVITNIGKEDELASVLDEAFWAYSQKTAQQGQGTTKGKSAGPTSGKAPKIVLELPDSEARKTIELMSEAARRDMELKSSGTVYSYQKTFVPKGQKLVNPDGLKDN